MPRVNGEQQVSSQKLGLEQNGQITPKDYGLVRNMFWHGSGKITKRYWLPFSFKISI